MTLITDEKVDFTIYRSSGKRQRYCIDAGGHSPDASRFYQLRLLDSPLMPGDDVAFGYGGFDLGTNFLLPPNVTFRGLDRWSTTLYSAWYGPVSQGCMIQLSDGSVVQDMTVDCRCPVDQQCETIGYSSAPGATNEHAVIERTILKGRGWVLYVWAGDNLGVLVRDTDLYGGRRLLAADSSSGPQAQSIEGHRLRFFGDSTLSTYQGSIGNHLIGADCRGGITKIYDSQFNMVGEPSMDFVSSVGIADAASNPSTALEVYNCVSRVTGGKQAVDVKHAAGLGTVKISGLGGSNADGSWSSSA